MYRTLCPINNSIYSYIVKCFNFTFIHFTSKYPAFYSSIFFD